MKRALAALTVLVCSAGAVVWIIKPWVPGIVISDPGATGRRVNERGVFANYFPARNATHGPAVLLLGGSEGGIKGMGVARSLQAAGFSVLQAGYFGGPHQPKQLERVPLETFDRSLAWLRTQPEVDAERVGVVGQSKGAEAALLVGTRDRALRAVVASSGSSYAWPGINWNSFKADSSWTSKGKDLPVLPYGPFHLFSFVRGDIGRVYREGLTKRARHPEAAIQPRAITAPVLLLCGEDDTLWPSCTMARQMKAREASVEVLAYAHAGHHVFGPPTKLDDPALRKWGGTPAGNNAARMDAWPKVLAFLHAALG